MKDITIADLTNALRGIPRDAVILIDTPDGPQRLQMIQPTRMAARGTALEPHPAGERYAIILKTTR